MPHLKSLADSFLDSARLDVDRLGDLLKRRTAGDRTGLADFERIAHSIHGTAAMFGYTALSGAGGALSRLVEAAMADRAIPGPGGELDLLEQLENGTQRLARQVEAARKQPPCGNGLLQSRSSAK